MPCLVLENTADNTGQTSTKKELWPFFRNRLILANWSTNPVHLIGGLKLPTSVSCHTSLWLLPGSGRQYRSSELLSATISWLQSRPSQVIFFFFHVTAKGFSKIQLCVWCLLAMHRAKSTVQNGRKELSWLGLCLPLQHHLLPIVFCILYASHILFFPESILPLSLCTYHTCYLKCLSLSSSVFLLLNPQALQASSPLRSQPRLLSLDLTSPQHLYLLIIALTIRGPSCLYTYLFLNVSLRFWRQRPYLFTFASPEPSPVLDWEYALSKHLVTWVADGHRSGKLYDQWAWDHGPLKLISAVYHISDFPSAGHTVGLHFLASFVVR